jgi:hypothetical protein
MSRANARTISSVWEYVYLPWRSLTFLPYASSRLKDWSTSVITTFYIFFEHHSVYQMRNENLVEWNEMRCCLFSIGIFSLYRPSAAIKISTTTQWTKSTSISHLLIHWFKSNVIYCLLAELCSLNAHSMSKTHLVVSFLSICC